MEALKLPLREAYERYTRSELSIMAWRSSELAFNMDQTRPQLQEVPNHYRGRTDSSEPDFGALFEGNFGPSDRQLAAIEQKLGPIAVKMVDEHGNVDLRKLTGDEAMRYMAALGIPIGGRI